VIDDQRRARPTGDPTGVFVLGMHRSGTSAVTRVVNLLGVATAASDDLLPPAPLNPTGFWESASLNDVNDEILRRFGGDSGSPPLLPQGWEFNRRLNDLYERAERCFLGTFTTTQWIWKDPRNCLTLPFWQLVTGARAIALIVYRNPLEVAASLFAHHGVRKDAALRIWERYVLDSLTHARGLPAYTLSYVDLISAPAAVAADLHGFLSRLDVRLSGLDAVSIHISGFVSSALRHYRADAGDIARDPDVTNSQRRLYAWLEGMGGAHPWLPAARWACRAPGVTRPGPGARRPFQV
jgi:hypothetical protein